MKRKSKKEGHREEAEGPDLDFKLGRMFGKNQQRASPPSSARSSSGVRILKQALEVKAGSNYLCPLFN
jgi:hypothetical protein